MNIVQYNPHRRAHFRSNGAANPFDSFFDDFFSPVARRQTSSLADVSQQFKVDIYEKDNSFFIDAELPGVKKDDISVDVKGKTITLSAERESDNDIKEEHNYRRERKYGKCTRTFNLPFELSDEKVKATYKNGILGLEIEKPVEQTVKKININ